MTKRLVGALALTALACGSNPHVSHGANQRQAATAKNPKLPPSAPAKKLMQEHPNARDCGEVVQPLDDDRCDVKRVFDCTMAAFKTCAPAHGVHNYAGPEGDAVRVDYFVLPKGGACEWVIVEDHSQDPLGKKGIVQKACQSAEWVMHHTMPGCEVIEPSECEER